MDKILDAPIVQQRYLPYWPYQEVISRPGYEDSLDILCRTFDNPDRIPAQRLVVIGNQLALTLAEMREESFSEAVCAQMINAFVSYRDSIEIYGGGTLQPVVNLSRLMRRNGKLESAWWWLRVFDEQTGYAETQFLLNSQPEDELRTFRSFINSVKSTETALLRLCSVTDHDDWIRICAAICRDKYNPPAFLPELELCALWPETKRISARVSDLALLYSDQADVLLAIAARILDLPVDISRFDWNAILPVGGLGDLKHPTSLKNLDCILYAGRLPPNYPAHEFEGALQHLQRVCPDRVAATRSEKKAFEPSLVAHWIDLALKYINYIYSFKMIPCM